jgi:hypothetical protein
MHRQFNEPHLKRRARFLRGLEIQEVSSVDRGANSGARVLLMKSDHQQENPMSLQQTIAKSADLRAQGRISKFDLAKMHQARATELGMTLAKYYDTAEGRRACIDAIACENFERMVRASNGDAYPLVEKARRSRETKEPVAMGEHAIHHDGPGDDRRAAADELEKFVGELMSTYKIDKHAAYDQALRTARGQKLMARANSAASYPVDDE